MTSKPLSGSSPSSPNYSNTELYILYISLYFSKWRHPSRCQVHQHHYQTTATRHYTFYIFLYISRSGDIQALGRFITINSSLSSPYCSSTPHILKPKKNFQGCQSCRRCSSCRDLEIRRSAQGVQHEGES